jgi:hypothetical protein
MAMGANPINFQQTLKDLETKMIQTCNAKWGPKSFSLTKPFGGNDNWGRTTILPSLFVGNDGVTVLHHWRQRLTSTGQQLLLAGSQSGYVLVDDVEVAWAGLAFPNKNQYITELKWQIGELKYGRLNIEEMLSYNKPALIFDEGLIINEKESFDLYGYVQGPVPTSGYMDTRMVMLGFMAYKNIDKVLGDTGSTIT